MLEELGDSRVPLRLTATRGALGIELYEPIEVGPLELVELEATFPGLRFPVDLSGGVPLFRHRRGRSGATRARRELLGPVVVVDAAACATSWARSSALPWSWAVPQGSRDWAPGGARRLGLRSLVGAAAR